MPSNRRLRPLAAAAVAGLLVTGVACNNDPEGEVGEGTELRDEVERELEEVEEEGRD